MSRYTVGQNRDRPQSLVTRIFSWQALTWGTTAAWEIKLSWPMVPCWGGYVEVSDQVFISAHCLVHQFVRVGTLSLMRGLSGTSRDVPPYSILDWQHTVRGVNVVGLKRAGFDDKRIREIREAFRILFRKGRNLSLAVKEVKEKSELSADVVALLEFIKSSKRGVCLGG